ncbi:Mu-like prophage FluMu I protein [plant metagenome]|uniref:Mu-like prophage FluMu I protein n=1 Tax=plant metagenome TaxID=1297885 RepID=A0A484TA68_9ZZZZ
MSKRTQLSATRTAVALAACSVQLPALGDTDVMELQVVPAGTFRPQDGRKIPVDAWFIDQAIASQVIQRFQARKTPLVIDYEHQTLNKEKNGQDAPAAAWFKSLTWREGQGLYATVALTARAREKIAALEYLFFSPVFTYDVPSGAVREIRMGALTNTPGIDGMEPLTLLAAATFGLNNPEEDHPVNELLKKLLAALGLPEETTEDQALEAVAALKTTPADKTDTAALCSVLGVAATANTTELVAACTSLKARADGASSQYVPLADFESVKTQLAVLTHQQNTSVIEDALATGKLLPAQKAWAEGLAKTDMAALTSYLATTAPIAALTATQTRGKPPVDDKGNHGLSSEELAVCSAMGLSPEAYAANKAGA